jgi:hypothetical protein
MSKIKIDYPRKRLVRFQRVKIMIRENMYSYPKSKRKVFLEQ